MISIQELQKQFAFQTKTAVRSTDAARTKGGVYACIVQQRFVYIGITENSLTQRILEHLRHPKTRFTKLIHKLEEKDVLWALVERCPFKDGQSRSLYREDLGEAEKRWIKRVGAYGTEHGLNETSGGKGTTDIVRSPEWVKETRERKRNLYSNPEQRRKQSAANAEAHRLNPRIAEEHSLRQKERYNGAGGKDERARVSEGMKSFLRSPMNLAQHSWDRGGRPFAIVGRSGLRGAFLNNSECARLLEFSSSSHVSKCLKNPGKAYKGNIAIKIGLGMLHEEILELAVSGDYEISNPLARGYFSDEQQVQTWQKGGRPFILANTEEIIGIFLDIECAQIKTGANVDEIALREGRHWICDHCIGIPVLNGITTEDAMKAVKNAARTIWH
jgi:hypothetical protein